MDNELKVFRNEKFGSVLTSVQNGDIWFLAKDVSSILGYRSAPDMTRLLDEEEQLLRSICVAGQHRAVIFINESGLYNAIFRSKKPESKDFRKWVTSEVLPSIRKNGGYIANQENLTPEQIVANALVVANNIINDQKKQLEENKPKVEVYEKISDSSTLQDLQTVAKVINLKNIFKVLQADNVIKFCSTEDGINYYKPYVAYSSYFVLKEKPFTKADGVQLVRPRLFVTGKGITWLTKKYGTKPLA